MMFGFAVRPIKPFLLASHPVPLQLVSGDLLSTGVAAAFARIGLDLILDGLEVRVGQTSHPQLPSKEG